MVVDFTGRKSGRHYSIPLSAHLIDGVLYALTGAVWKNNFRGGATATVLHDGKTTKMRGELIADKAHVVDLYLRCVEGYGVKRAERAIGIRFRNHQMPTRDEFGLRRLRDTACASKRERDVVVGRWCRCDGCD
jgi:hypothetical protein